MTCGLCRFRQQIEDGADECHVDPPVLTQTVDEDGTVCWLSLRPDVDEQDVACSRFQAGSSVGRA